MKSTTSFFTDRGLDKRKRTEKILTYQDRLSKERPRAREENEDGSRSDWDEADNGDKPQIRSLF
jgi:hypothetical protein